MLHSWGACAGTKTPKYWGKFCLHHHSFAHFCNLIFCEYENTFMVCLQTRVDNFHVLPLKRDEGGEHGRAEQHLVVSCEMLKVMFLA